MVVVVAAAVAVVIICCLVLVSQQVPAFLIFVKIIVLPIVGKAVTQWLGGSVQLSSATFIYCAIPTTGGVFLYALQ